MRHLVFLAPLIFAVACGGYVGTEGVYWNPDTMTGFRTLEFDAEIEERLAAAGDNEELPEPSGVQIATGDQVAELAIDPLKSVVPGMGFLVFIIGLFKRNRNSTRTRTRTARRV